MRGAAGFSRILLTLLFPYLFFLFSRSPSSSAFAVVLLRFPIPCIRCGLGVALGCRRSSVRVEKMGDKEGSAGSGGSSNKPAARRRECRRSSCGFCIVTRHFASHRSYVGCLRCSPSFCFAILPVPVLLLLLLLVFCCSFCLVFLPSSPSPLRLCLHLHGSAVCGVAAGALAACADKRSRRRRRKERAGQCSESRTRHTATTNGSRVPLSAHGG